MVVVVKRSKIWLEPVHPWKSLRDDLEKLYRVIHAYQQEIDEAFDGVSKKIGFVALTAVPITVEVGEKGKINNIAMGAENMKGTIFEDALFKAMEPMRKESTQINPGSFEVLLFWEPALKYVLNAAMDECTTAPDSAVQFHLWKEPAHVFRIRKDILDVINPDYQPGMGNDLIDVIDKVYTDLKLGDSIRTITRS
ncbi:MAG: hypothetical protein LUQ38_12910 [Methanotrichaceae archaeon]|nr:hypothetical protein [Methanotrichaceae archaeon]